MASRAEMPGLRFGRLVVLRCAGENHLGHPKWLCRCDCGQEKVVAHSGLVAKGHTRSCGCLLREVSRARCTTHGMGGTPTHTTWRGMIGRCRPGQPNARLYGDRGITVCDRWRESFANFLADMGERPPGTSLDRIDNDGNYEPANCRWATRDEQQRNSRRCRTYEFRGEHLRLKDWAQRMGLSYRIVKQRFHIHGWPLERALTTPKGRYRESA